MSVAVEQIEDEELEIKNSLSNSLKQNVLNKLRENNYLNYGAVIPESFIESCMNEKKSKLSFDKWQFLILQFREIIKNQGYYVTSRGHNNDLYILHAHEMAIYNERKNKVALNNLKQRQRALHMVDSSLLSNEAQKKLEFEILRNSSLELEMVSKMKERCRF